MSIIGTTLGHNTLSTLIGCRGMGEVYQARDQKLGWNVVIKVLREEFAKEADRVARFQRKAELASLNHPSMTGIYAQEQANSGRKNQIFVYDLILFCLNSILANIPNFLLRRRGSMYDIPLKSLTMVILPS